MNHSIIYDTLVVVNWCKEGQKTTKKYFYLNLKNVNSVDFREKMPGTTLVCKKTRSTLSLQKPYLKRKCLQKCNLLST